MIKDMKVTLSEFVVKSLIEEKSIDLLYVHPKYLLQFLAGLEYAAANYGVEKDLAAIIDDQSAVKFTELYEEICAIVASFGGKPAMVSEEAAADRLDELNLKEFTMPKHIYGTKKAVATSVLYH